MKKMDELGGEEDPGMAAEEVNVIIIVVFVVIMIIMIIIMK